MIIVLFFILSISASNWCKELSNSVTNLNLLNASTQRSGRLLELTDMVKDSKKTEEIHRLRLTLDNIKDKIKQTNSALNDIKLLKSYAVDLKDRIDDIENNLIRKMNNAEAKVDSLGSF